MDAWRGLPVCSLSPPVMRTGAGPLVRISQELSPSGSLTPFLLLFFFFIFSLSTDTELFVLTDSELLVLLGRVISWWPTELATVVSLFFFFFHLRKKLTNSSFFKDRAQILSIRRGKTLKVTCDPSQPQSCVLAFSLRVANKNCWPKSASLRITDSLIAHNHVLASPSCWEHFCFSLFCKELDGFLECLRATP